MNKWCFRPRFCTVRLYWAGDNLGEWVSGWLVFLGHDSALRLYWAGDNLGEWDEFCYVSGPLRRIDHSTCRPAVQRATTVPRMPLDYDGWIIQWFLLFQLLILGIFAAFLWIFTTVCWELLGCLQFTWLIGLFSDSLFQFISFSFYNVYVPQGMYVYNHNQCQ